MNGEVVTRTNQCGQFVGVNMRDDTGNRIVVGALKSSQNRVAAFALKISLIRLLRDLQRLLRDLQQNARALVRVRMRGEDDC